MMEVVSLQPVCYIAKCVSIGVMVNEFGIWLNWFGILVFRCRIRSVFFFVSSKVCVGISGA